MTVDFAVADLRELLELALQRAEPTLSSGELHVLRAILALEGDAARVYARLSARKPGVFAVEDLVVGEIGDLAPAIAELSRLGFVDTLVTWDQRASECTVKELAAGCRLLGLPTTGKREGLLTRLAGQRGFDARTWIRVRHKPLILRCLRWALLRKHVDRSELVVERLGHVVWPTYTPTGGALFADRRAMRHWETTLHELPAMTAEQAYAALRHGRFPPGRLNPTRRLVERIVEAAADAERLGELARARTYYGQLVSGGWRSQGASAIRLSRAWEAEGQVAAAVDVLREGLRDATPVERLGILRTAKRLTRGKGGFPPDPPRRLPRHREFGLTGAGGATRPLWRVDEQVAPIEASVVRWLRLAGRTALHTEGAVWTTLFAILFYEAYFWPVPGALPAPRLSGPLDLGTPGFSAQRPAPIAATRALIEAGQAATRIRALYPEVQGRSLAGAAWGVASGEELAAIAEGVGPRGLLTILDGLLVEGFAAARGLPDLVVLPGPDVKLAAQPSRLPEGLVLVEIKGPTDTVRDEQTIWFDRLVSAGVPVELWLVRRNEA